MRIRSICNDQGALDRVWKDQDYWEDRAPSLQECTWWVQKPSGTFGIGKRGHLRHAACGKKIAVSTGVISFIRCCISTNYDLNLTLISLNMPAQFYRRSCICRAHHGCRNGCEISKQDFNGPSPPRGTQQQPTPRGRRPPSTLGGGAWRLYRKKLKNDHF